MNTLNSEIKTLPLRPPFKLELYFSIVLAKSNATLGLSKIEAVA